MSSQISSFCCCSFVKEATLADLVSSVEMFGQAKSRNSEKKVLAGTSNKVGIAATTRPSSAPSRVPAKSEANLGTYVLVGSGLEE